MGDESSLLGLGTLAKRGLAAVVAAVVLVLSWILDTVFVSAMPGGTTAGAVKLAVMHLTASVVAVAMVTDRCAPALLE